MALEANSFKDTSVHTAQWYTRVLRALKLNRSNHQIHVSLLLEIYLVENPLTLDCFCNNLRIVSLGYCKLT